MTVKLNVLIWILFILLFVVSRIPGMLPPNFSVAYAFIFCAGVYLRGRTGWIVPLLAMLASDLVVNYWYHLKYGLDIWSWRSIFHMFLNYCTFALLFLLGRCFTPRHSLLQLSGGGILGSIIFYLVSNTLVWFLNPFGAPEYTRDLKGWIWALTIGTSGWPETWVFFRNTLLSGGLFTGLFVGAAKLVEALEAEPERESASEQTPEEASAEEPAK